MFEEEVCEQETHGCTIDRRAYRHHTTGQTQVPPEVVTEDGETGNVEKGGTYSIDNAVGQIQQLEIGK